MVTDGNFDGYNFAFHGYQFWGFMVTSFEVSRLHLFVALWLWLTLKINPRINTLSGKKYIHNCCTQPVVQKNNDLWSQGNGKVELHRPANFPRHRITLQATALRVMWKRSLRRSGVFPEVQACVSECFWRLRSVFQIHEKSWFFTTYGSKKNGHEPNSLIAPYSAYILWKLMIL